MGLSAPCHFCAKSIECEHIKPHLDVKIAFIPMMRGHFGKHKGFFSSQVKLGFWEHLGRTMKCIQKYPIIPCYFLFTTYACIYLFVYPMPFSVCKYVCWFGSAVDLKMFFAFLKILTCSLCCILPLYYLHYLCITMSMNKL